MLIMLPNHNLLQHKLHIILQWITDLMKAAKAGQAGAQFYLATHYQYGKDVAKDENKLLLGLKQQQIRVFPAQLNVGRMYADGVGVAKNEAMARKYFEKAASNGDNRASL
jgi:TPR repeat protein